MEFGDRDAQIQFEVDANRERIRKMALVNLDNPPVSGIERTLTRFWKRVGKRPIFTIEDYGWHLGLHAGVYGDAFFVEVL